MSSSAMALVERYLIEAMNQPADAFWVTHLDGLDSSHFQLVVASPKGMSGGGDLAFAVEGGIVHPGSRATLARIIRTEGLLSGDEPAADVDRFLRLFFLLAEVGVGGPTGEPAVDRTADGVHIRASASGAFPGLGRSYDIRVAPDGEVRWEVGR